MAAIEKESNVVQIQDSMYYILFYQTVDNYTVKRIPFRDEHLAYAQKAHTSGSLLMAGALTDPVDSAVLIFRGEGPEIAEEFAMNDPYVRNGLITKWHVRQWTVVIGNE
jgi:uncharacterized protein